MFFENVLWLYKHIYLFVNTHSQMGPHYKSYLQPDFFFHLTHPRHVCVSVDIYILNCFKGGHRTPLYGCMIIYSVRSLMTPFLSWSVSLYYKTIIKIYMYLCVTCMSISV